MRTSRFQSFAPPLRTNGLRRLKTAFSPSSSTSSNHSYNLSGSSTASAGIFSSSSSTSSTMSPLSACGDDVLSHSPTTSSCCSSVSKRSSGANFPPVETSQELPGRFTPLMVRSRLRAILMGRRKQSVVDLRFEEEQQQFGARMAVFEPRPQEPMAMGGIFEILEGRA